MNICLYKLEQFNHPSTPKVRILLFCLPQGQSSGAEGWVSTEFTFPAFIIEQEMPAENKHHIPEPKTWNTDKYLNHLLSRAVEFDFLAVKTSRKAVQGHRHTMPVLPVPRGLSICHQALGSRQHPQHSLLAKKPVPAPATLQIIPPQRHEVHVRRLYISRNKTAPTLLSSMVRGCSG